MITREVVDIVSKKKSTVSFFDDDSIDIVRQQIAKSLDSHPDRLFILVGITLPVDYYTKDPRRWESLFERLSYNGEPIEKEIFEEYQRSYRSPNTSIAFSPYDKSEWMDKPEKLNDILQPTTQTVEYRILGVEETKSFILPLNSDTPLTARIPSARHPIPDLKFLLSSFYNIDTIVNFLVREQSDDFSPIYFPLFRSTTPPRLSVESIGLLDKNSKQLKDLLALESPEPESISIIRTRFYVPWVNTDFGAAVRTRFEQLFYGLTVSKDVPYIGLFTSKDQVTRHKFFVENANEKTPFLDMSVWSTWWSLTKPSRSKPTLVIYRGKSKHHFDRIAITSIDMVVSTYRPEGNNETLDELRSSANEWLATFDSITPFLQKEDIDFERWELQDLSFVAKYKETINEFDLLRFPCISSIFNISDKSKSQFSLLRTDNEHDGLSAIEVKILQMMKESRVSNEDVATELGVTTKIASDLINSVQNRLEEEPRLGQKSFRGYPSLRLGPDFVIVSSVREVDHPLAYSNMLRYILSSDSEELNKVCPKRMERVSADTTIVPTVQEDAAIENEFSDLFEYIEEASEETESVSESVTTTQKILTDQRQGTIYNYFKNRLQQFDPETFHSSATQYPKKCEQKHQPIILSGPDLTRLKGTPYDPKSYAKDDQLVDIENPDGTIVCPEYWCMRDQIPLQESQLEREGGEIRCPVCRGKLQTDVKDNPQEYPLIKRQTGHVYPGFVDYKSPKNDKNMPCCFIRSRANKLDKDNKEDKYYILGDTKTGLKNGRIAFLSTFFRESLYINEKYEGLEKSRRLTGGTSGFFRVGVDHFSESLPSFLDLKTKIPFPRESVDTVLKCSFLRTWKNVGTHHLDSIKNDLKKLSIEANDHLVRLISGIDEAYSKKELTPLEELEYSALALQCDVFRIHTTSNTLGCIFYTPIVRPRSRGIVVLQNDNEIDILGHVIRKTQGFSFESNVFKSPFKKETYVELEKLRNAACKTEVPSYSDALNIMRELAVDDYSIVLDPFARGQAFYVPFKYILPFQSRPLPDVVQAKINGYSEVDKLPKYSDVRSYLETAQKFSKGYAFKEDLFNNQNQRVEIATESGLRIPVEPETVQRSEPSEIIETVRDITESELTFGESSKELKDTQKEISYSSEVFEFLIYQLTKDIFIDRKDLGNVLKQVLPKKSEVEPLLQKWFDETTKFVDVKHPIEFLSKIRTPCGQFTSKSTCSGNLCGWDSEKGKCNIQIKQTIQKEKLFHRLLSTLLENGKIRSMILDGRTTPFFSSVLYLELPHELIVTDSELDVINV
jgi:hypothetical protein